MRNAIIDVIVHLYDTTTVGFTGDEVHQRENYKNTTSLGAGPLGSYCYRFQSLQTLQEIECKHNAEIGYGYNPDQVEEIQVRWG